MEKPAATPINSMAASIAAQMELDFIQHVLFDPRRGNLKVIAQMLSHQRDAATSAVPANFVPNLTPPVPKNVMADWRYNGMYQQQQQQQQQFVPKSIASCHNGKQQFEQQQFVPKSIAGCHNGKQQFEQQQQFMPKSIAGCHNGKQQFEQQQQFVTKSIAGCHNGKQQFEQQQQQFVPKSTAGCHHNGQCQQQQQPFVTKDEKHSNCANNSHHTEAIILTVANQRRRQQPVPVVGRPKTRPSRCQVCGRPSQYFYYGAKCCESCKQFFRRVVSKQIIFNCFGTKNCQIGEGGIKCRGCRLDKCLLSGMDPTMIKRDKAGSDQYLARLELRKSSAFLRKTYEGSF